MLLSLDLPPAPGTLGILFASLDLSAVIEPFEIYSESAVCFPVVGSKVPGALGVLETFLSKLDSPVKLFRPELEFPFEFKFDDCYPCVLTF